MSSILEKTVRLFLVTFLLLLLTPGAFADGPVSCDGDGDGYISLTAEGMDVILGETFDANGNYSAAEWSNFFKTFKNDPDSATLCNALNFKKGAEPVRCDKGIIEANSGVFDPAKVTGVSGTQVNPGAFDKPSNGIDEDCNGEDGKLIEIDNGGKDLDGITDRSIVLLSRAVVVVSIIFLLWGGFLYASAAGDENKTRKAKKAMIGAVIGLVVGLLAPTIVSFIVSLI